MAHGITRVRNLVVANAPVLVIVAATAIKTSHFETKKFRASPEKAWPVPGVLIQQTGSPVDPQLHTGDVSFSTQCYGETDVLAMTLHFAVRLALTGKSEFGTLTAENEAAQGVLWRAQGLIRITEEVGGQPLTEPESGHRGREFVLAQYRAILQSS